MAFNNYMNQPQKQVTPTVYSPYRMNNANGEVEQTCITFSYWNQLLKIQISPKKNTGNDEIAFDFDNGISVCINHIKARMLANEIKLFLEDPARYNSSGISSGQGLITISNGSDIGSTHPCIIIRKTDEIGNIVSSFAYEFKDNYYFSIRNYSENSTGGQFEKNFDDYRNIEILDVLTLLEEYYKSVTAAHAYEVVEQIKYDHTRMNNRIEAIGSKLGVEFGDKRNSSNNYSSKSYFNSATGNSNVEFQSATIDDLDD